MFAYFFDLFKGVKFASIDSRTDRRCHVPVGRALKIRRPEGPGPALVRAGRIYAAASLTGNLRKEYAVFADRFFDYCGSVAYAPEEPAAELVESQLQMVREHFNLGLGYPYIAFVRTSAAVAALGTLKVQTADIPLLFIISCHIHHFSIAPVSALVAIEAYFAR